MSQISTSVTIINSGLKGFIALSLTNFTSTAVSAIASGSAVEVAGAFFLADGDITINASSWTAITTASTAYLTLTPSGSAGSQTIAAAWTATAPVWNTSKQGWYATAASSVRVVASAYKDGPTTATNKKILEPYQYVRPHGCEVFTTSGSFIVPIGVDTLYITGCAAGGNGGKNVTYARGYGGGGGEWAIKKSFIVTPLETLTVTIGAVGTVTSVIGANTFTLNHGKSASDTAPGSGGSVLMGTGAGGAGGDYYFSGKPGFSPGGAAHMNLTDTTGAGGGGGSYGGGGSGTTQGGKGGYGGGGSGTISTNPGAGGPAIIILEW
jgi:hypothetical protein